MTPSYVLEYENITPIFEVSDSESPKRSNTLIPQHFDLTLFISS